MIYCDDVLIISMMIKVLRDLLRSYLKEQVSNQRKLQKSKLLIYDEYLNKYVSADELLIPGIKESNKGAVPLTKSKELFVFDLLFKKFVNPKLDLLIPGTKIWDHYVKSENIKTSSRDFFWGKKKVKKHAVLPLPPVHSKPSTDTEPPQVGWAGQKTRKPDTDPRPEISKPECKLGPGKDPKKKKPPKKKKEKNKYLICSTKKEPMKNMEDISNKKDAVQTTKESSKDSEGIVYNGENCYSGLKEKGKQLQSPDLKNDVSNTHLKSLIKEDKFVENLIKESEKTQTNNDGVFKIICSKLFSKKLNIKEPSTRQSISDPHSKINVCDVNSNTTSLSRNENGNHYSPKDCNENKSSVKHETNLDSNQTKALVCKKQWPSSLIPSEDSRATNIYLCKDKGDKPNIENQLCKPVCKRNLFQSKTRETKHDKLELFNYNKEEKDKINDTYTCSNKTNVGDCPKKNSIKDSCMDRIKCECKIAIAKRPNTTPLETSDSSKVKDHKRLNNTQSEINKSEISSFNFMGRPKTAGLQKPCSKATSLMISEQSRGDCNSNNTNVIKGNKKSDRKNEEPCKCSSAEKSKVKEMCSEKNELKNHKSPEYKPLKIIIDPESSEKLQCITQEKFFKRANLSTDLNKCSSYLGFKVKQNSETKTTSEISPTDKEIDSKKTPHSEVPCKKNKKSKTVLKTTKSNDTVVQSETNRDSFKASKSETFKNDTPTKQTLNKKTQDCKEVSTKSICKNNVSLSNAKQETETKMARGSDSKDNIKERQQRLSKKTSLTKLSKKCKSTLDVKASQLKLKKIGKNQNNLNSSKKQPHNKQPNEKSNPCSKPSVSSEKKDLKENMKHDSGMDGCCCKNLTNQTAQAQDKQVCCKKTENGTDKSCSEGSPTPYERQPTSDKETVQCHTAKANSNEITVEVNNIEQHKSKGTKNKDTTKETNNNGEHKCKKIKKEKNKCKPKLKQIITGAMQGKKTNLCRKNKSFQSYKSQGKSSKVNQTKLKNLPGESQKNKDSLQNIKISKSKNVCSENKSNDRMDEYSKKSKSKHSICSKKEKGHHSEHSKNQNVSQKGENLSKLNKLVRRAKCSTDSVTKKRKPVKQFKQTLLICSKSSPSIQPVKNNTLRVGAISKKPSSSNTSDGKSQKAKASKNELKNSKMCSLHTLQKRMTEVPIKTSKRINVKSFSELKTVNNSTEQDTVPDHFSSRSYSSTLNLQCNHPKKGMINNCKETSVQEERTLQKTEQTSLNTPNWVETELIDKKIKNFSPSLKDYRYFQRFLSSLKHETEAIKFVPKDTLKLGKKKTRKNEYCVPIRNGEGKKVTLILNTVKEYSNGSLKICDGKNTCKTNTDSLVSKDSNSNVDEFHKTNNTIKKLNITTKNTSPNNRDTINSNNIKNEGSQVNYKFKDGRLISNGNSSSIFKGFSTEPYLTKAFLKADEPKKRPPCQPNASKFQHKARDTPNTTDTSNIDKKSLIQTVRAKSAAATESLNNAVSIPHNTLSPSKTKSFSSLNAFKLCDTVTKQEIRPLKSPKRETFKDLELQTFDTKSSQDKNSHPSKLSSYPQNKISDKCQVQFTKYDKSANSNENKSSHMHDKIGFYQELVPYRKLQSLQVNEPKQMMTRNDSTCQDNGRKNNVCNETILCDFIEGSINVDVQNINPQNAHKSSNSILNQHQHTKNLKIQTVFHLAGKENKTKPCFTVDKNYLKYNEANKKEFSNASRSTSTNKTLIDTIENHAFKLDAIVPSMKRICKPVHLNSKFSVENEKQKFNNEISAVNTLVKDKTFEKIKNTGLETERKVVQENSNIRQTKKSDLNEMEREKKIVNLGNTLISENNNEKLQEIASNKCSSNILQAKIQKDNIKVDYDLKQGIASQTSAKSKYSPKSKTKMQLISKRHRKFIIYNHKKLNSTAAKIDNGTCEKPVPKKTIKPHSDITNENNNTAIQNNKMHLNIYESLSSKQAMLLMKQPFLKQSKSEPSTDPVLRISKPEISMVTPTKDDAKATSSPKQLASQPRLLIEKPVYKRPNSDPSSENLLHISTPKTGMVTSNKSNTKGPSSPKQSASQLSLSIEQHVYKVPNSESSSENVLHISKPDTGKVIGSSSLKQPARQLRLLMNQPFYKKPKPEPSTDPVLHEPNPETGMAASNKDSTKGISYSKQPAAHPKHQAKQSVFKRSKSEPSSENAVHNSKPDTRAVSSNKDDTKGDLFINQPTRQIRLLMEQPFYKIFKSESSSENVVHTPKPGTSMFASNKDTTKSISSPKQPVRQPSSFIEPRPKSETSSENVLHIPKTETRIVASNKGNREGSLSPKQPARQLRLLMEQPFYKQFKSEPNTENLPHSSKSENSTPKPKHQTENELRSVKSKSVVVASNKDSVRVISPRKQQSSIRSQLQSKIPTKAVIQVNLKNTDQD